MQAVVRAFFDEAIYTVSHVVHDPDATQAAAIDRVLSYLRLTADGIHNLKIPLDTL